VYTFEGSSSQTKLTEYGNTTPSSESKLLSRAWNTLREIVLSLWSAASPAPSTSVITANTHTTFFFLTANFLVKHPAHEQREIELSIALAKSQPVNLHFLTTTGSLILESLQHGQHNTVKKQPRFPRYL
jgi:hypothetical protein